MFGASKAAKAQGVAEDAWEALLATWESARGRTGDLVDTTQHRVGSATDEAIRRAAAAYDALAGHRPAKPWGLLVAALAAGAALGWVAAAAIARQVEPGALERDSAPDESGITAAPPATP